MHYNLCFVSWAESSTLIVHVDYHPVLRQFWLRHVLKLRLYITIFLYSNVDIFYHESTDFALVIQTTLHPNCIALLSGSHDIKKSPADIILIHTLTQIFPQYSHSIWGL